MECDNSLKEYILIEPRSSRPQSTNFSGLSASLAFRSPRHGGASLDGLSPVMSDSWATMMNTPLLPVFQKSSTANNNAAGVGQTADLTNAELNHLYGSNSVPRLDDLEKFRLSSKGPMHNNSGSSA